MKKHKAMQLVKALRSGAYQQGTGRLVNSEDEFCCLGVACNISKQAIPWGRNGGSWEMAGEDQVLPKAIQLEFGFVHNTGGRVDYEPITIGGERYVDLMDANDEGVSFADIADYIEKNWEYL